MKKRTTFPTIYASSCDGDFPVEIAVGSATEGFPQTCPPTNAPRAASRLVSGEGER